MIKANVIKRIGEKMLSLDFSLTSPFLFLALRENNRCLISLQKENHRLHADNFLTHLETILKQVNRSLPELEEVYFTSFPSGQTGLRVSLTFLITLQALNPQVKLYQINTLLLQAGNDNCLSLLTLDKRESKYYAAVYSQQRCLLVPQLIQKEKLFELMKQFKGFLVRKDFREKGFAEIALEFNKSPIDLGEQFRTLKSEFIPVERVEELDF